MTIIDFASGEKASASPPDLKEVVFYLDDRGGFSTYGSQAREVRALVPQDLDQEGIEKLLRLRANVVALENKLSELKTGQGMIQDLQAMQVNKGTVDGSDFDRLQNLIPSEKLGTMKSNLKKDAPQAIKQAQAHIEAEKQNVEAQLNRARADLNTVQSPSLLPPSSVSFGPPTQFNGLYGGGLLQLQQQLNTVQRPGLRYSFKALVSQRGVKVAGHLSQRKAGGGRIELIRLRFGRGL